MVRFSSADLLSMVEAVLDELAANPAWLLDPAGQLNENLKTALEGALGVIRNRADQRLSAATAVQAISAAVAAVSLRKEFLDQMSSGDAAAGQTIIAAVLDAIFRTVFDPVLDIRAAWQIVRAQVILDLLKLSLAELAKAPLAPARVNAFATFIKQQVASLAENDAWDSVSFTAKLRQALAA
jgi:hypothetical protein